MCLAPWLRQISSLPGATPLAAIRGATLVAHAGGDIPGTRNSFRVLPESPRTVRPLGNNFFLNVG